ncbi:hypothetical protein FGO68_gene11019 [Halteria grandinella]|uniref:Uncharacterized protein n=1 Tax=Halteria grandinella TaxID=5974 RepID=A0A8J8SV70_HALGN|nr:hypothetical protein FGO68_gene11019 [Halteria grandinella]
MTFHCFATILPEIVLFRLINKPNRQFRKKHLQLAYIYLRSQLPKVFQIELLQLKQTFDCQDKGENNGKTKSEEIPGKRDSQMKSEKLYQNEKYCSLVIYNKLYDLLFFAGQILERTFHKIREPIKQFELVQKAADIKQPQVLKRLFGGQVCPFGQNLYII